MMDQVARLRTDADLLIHIVDGERPPGKDDVVWETLDELKLPVMLVVNKVDLISQERLLEVQQQCTEMRDYIEVIPVSALHGVGVDELVRRLKQRLPEGPEFYSKEDVSDLPLRFFVSELIREQLFILYQQEIPYSCAVNVIEYKEGDEMDRIHAEIVVNRESQKGILIGKKGKMLKELGIRSRKSVEELVEKKVHLELFVKVREKWREKESFLKSYGYR